MLKLTLAITLAILAGALGVPVNVGLARSAPPAPVKSAVVNVTAPVRPLNETTVEASAACTKAVVAIWVVFVPKIAVGAVGVPVKAGLAKVAPPAAETSAKVSVTAPVRPLNEATPVLSAAIAA